jgi:hypothetical protein
MHAHARACANKHMRAFSSQGHLIIKARKQHAQLSKSTPNHDHAFPSDLYKLR